MRRRAKMEVDYWVEITKNARVLGDTKDMTAAKEVTIQFLNKE